MSAFTRFTVDDLEDDDDRLAFPSAPNGPFQPQSQQPPPQPQQPQFQSGASRASPAQHPRTSKTTTSNSSSSSSARPQSHLSLVLGDEDDDDDAPWGAKRALEDSAPASRSSSRNAQPYWAETSLAAAATGSGLHSLRINRFTNAASALFYSKYYFIVYMIVVVLCLTSLIWSLTDSKEQVVGVIVIEVVINVILIFELFIRFMSLGAKAYFASWWNRFDLLVLLLCVGALITYIASTGGENQSEQVEDVVSLVLLVIRSVLQVIRVTLLLRSQYRQLSTRREVDILRVDRKRTDSMSNMLSTSDENLHANNYLLGDEDDSE
ncbi:hypothetical protein CAOG_08681 [Capsaspora owczarzaki ATCC 30864]|uniref:Ion transport domain-containing protein n=1 Tax=Capsaspora owczarzaki (strain ATCC 30864) TaxID=595528 RepID=A0A0D2UB17_CAPO3|nr:hypothetical protein CAOG_08681 [Capsaspora owczarzaki ATCC 30864]KJE92246.1 hypothetical protein CAOG_008681 [Capsaspora owczarzaki ATCC 30864]|eukprot:XP_011270292.1 hypothetical protein CAOG_08681 [Capsaspora owczarzaki ATCC 30864]